MIVFDLRCDGGHVFESWFGSSADYADQKERGLVRCPMCDSASVEKAVMAPNVAAKGNQRATTGADPMKAALAALAKAQEKALEGSEWVGSRFADRARAMHLGEEATAPIHGQATPQEARALVEEGVPVAPLPLPVVPPGARN
ncbi:DUF1178 family protein [Sphingomonas desiccabilis]|uniref:DUF1178 family protein n=1 Tax=Sphingomonas desiccabilis TaxID=429134 RepID=A0A4Q2IZR6_9SPHN|nr:DUF1178 family protein [Sphingomonas desiccabilis]MBB3910073.1 hypothetical protein [Sphingomonas desiccabilis]RXZ34764.1 DUF1178 family protein [Sphingomonas desiccabilis]